MSTAILSQTNQINIDSRINLETSSKNPCTTTNARHNSVSQMSSIGNRPKLRSSMSTISGGKELSSTGELLQLPGGAKKPPNLQSRLSITGSDQNKQELSNVVKKFSQNLANVHSISTGGAKTGGAMAGARMAASKWSGRTKK